MSNIMGKSKGKERNLKLKKQRILSKNLIMIFPVLFLLILTIHALTPSKEFQVNTYTKDMQWYPDTAMNANGDFVVVWESEGQDGDIGGIFAQRFNSQGQSVKKEFQVNTNIASVQGSPAVAMDRAGNFVVVWESYGQDGDRFGIFGQVYKKTGKKLNKEFQVNTTTKNHQLFPDVAMDAKGNFVVTWTMVRKKKNMFDIFAQRFSRTGKPLGDEFQVNTYVDNNQWLSQVSMDRKGNFVIVWESFNQDSDSGGVYAQLYSKTGKKIGDEFRVNTTFITFQGYPSVAMDIRGNFVVAWDCYWFDGDNYGIFAKIFDSDGNPITDEFQVNEFTEDSQLLSHVSMDKRGNCIFVWESYHQDTSKGGVYAKRFKKDGTGIGSEFRVNQFIPDNQGSPRAAMSYKGDFVVIWESFDQDGDHYGIFGRYYKK